MQIRLGVKSFWKDKITFKILILPQKLSKSKPQITFLTRIIPLFQIKNKDEKNIFHIYVIMDLSGESLFLFPHFDKSFSHGNFER